MNRFFFTFIMIIWIFSCESTIKKELKIKPFKIDLKLTENLSQQSRTYHVYFKSMNSDDKSFGINIFYPSNEIIINLYPGIYNIYCYGLVEKTLTSKKVFSYKIMKQIGIYNSQEINIDLLKFMPDYNISKYDNDYLLTIYMKDIYDIFSVSSLSIKQGTNKASSIEYKFDSVNLLYYSVIQLIQNGNWYMNISYDLKTKIDEEVLKRDNIIVSTSNFSDIFLGDF